MPDVSELQISADARAWVAKLRFRVEISCIVSPKFLKCVLACKHGPAVVDEGDRRSGATPTGLYRLR